MPLEVLVSPRADQRIATLTRQRQRNFEQFLDMLAAEGCEALAYRLAGDPPINHLCVKHLDGNLRVIVGFGSQDRAWIVLIGEHDDSDASANIYDELYDLLEVDPPESERAKPPCRSEPGPPSPCRGVVLEHHWRSDHRGIGVYPENHLWDAVHAYLDLLRARGAGNDDTH